MLRNAAKGVCNAMLRAPAAAGQRRAAGNLPYKPNKYVEEWAARRENIENEFVFDSAALRRGIVWIVGVPFLVYTTITTEFHESDKMAGRKPRVFFGDD